MNDLKTLLQVNEHQDRVYMPSEIFNDLKPLHSKGSSHVAFAYSFYYLISWLYRYAKYGELNIDTGMIKQVLGYSKTYPEINYIIKKNGFLDQIGYTVSSTDYPIAWSFNNGDIDFTLLSDLDSELRKIIQSRKGKNYKIKIPVKAIWRNEDSQIEGIEDGTIYEIEYTHEMPFDVFMKCMSNKRIGIEGFYIYGYLKYRCDKFGTYQSSIERIAEDLGMSRNTADKYLTGLAKEQLIAYKDNGCKLIEGQFKKQAYSYSIA